MLRKGHIVAILVIGIILYYPITADAKSYNIYFGTMTLGCIGDMFNALGGIFGGTPIVDPC